MTHPVRILMCAVVVCGSWRMLVACAPPDYTAGTKIAEACDDGERNGDETDVDCGGTECPACVVGQSCRSSSDCADNECTGGVCRSPHCANGRVDQDETGVDCGGTECPACEEPACDNGVVNEGETDLDCGGPDCDPCELGKKCSVAKDCASGYCGDSGKCEDPHCLNGEVDASETDEDCGGPDCKACAEGKACTLPRDCMDLVCKEGECQPASCNDDVQNGSETDTDCGGDCDEACPDGGGCTQDSDCESRVCSDHVCQEPTCDDGVKNGDETGTDCGGAQCRDVRTCSAKQPCLDHADCATGWCDPDDKRCVEPTCDDGFLNDDETDIDCGGSCAAGCEGGFHCVGPDDCESSNCVDTVCQASTCDDGIRNQGEGAIDCGGSSPCEPCIEGTPCSSDSACASGVCDVHGLCAAPACNDDTQNGLETDVDCGGDNECPRCGALKKCLVDSDCEQDHQCPPENGVCVIPECANGTLDEGETDQDCGGACPPCADDMDCLSNKDCQSRVCDEDTNQCVPATCEDGVKNGDESYEDCGGTAPECPRCAVGQPCNTGSDCVSSSCGQEEDKAATTCLQPTCEDGVKNGDEIGTDCRGSCPDKCAANEPCTGNADCASGVCTSKVCQAPRCDDRTKNGSETDVDCGGNCDPCDDLLHCTEPSDCQSKVCTGSTCQVPSCEDGVRNDGETGEDCGGDCLPLLCPNGEGCSSGDDCKTGVCRYDVCVPPDCEDGAKTGEETDIDCGGSKCSACGVGKDCLVGRDCASLSCGAAKVCLKATCDDEIKNQEETDVDCGGSGCAGCGTGKVCLADSNCVSDVCRAGPTGLVCQAPTCSDQTKNQGEGDVDCGGGVCTRCVAGKSCGQANDCRSGLCSAGKCQQGEVEVYFFGTAQGNQEYWVNLQVKNIGSSNIDLKDYTFRYYFSFEVTNPPERMDYQNSLSDVTFTKNADGTYYAVLLPLSNVVTPGSTSSTLRFRLHSGGTTMDWTNDYSYGPQSTFSQEPWLTTPAYRGSTLVFGIPRP